MSSGSFLALKIKLASKPKISEHAKALPVPQIEDNELGTNRAHQLRVTTRRRVLLAVLLTAGTLISLGIIAAARIPFSSETLRVRLIDALEQRLDVDADLSSLTLRFHPSLRAVGTGLRLRSKEQPDAPPLIEVEQFTVDANLRGLWNRHVAFVKLDGLRIQIPPDDGKVDANDTPDPPPPPSTSSD